VITRFRTLEGRSLIAEVVEATDTAIRGASSSTRANSRRTGQFVTTPLIVNAKSLKQHRTLVRKRIKAHLGPVGV